MHLHYYSCYQKSPLLKLATTVISECSCIGAWTILLWLGVVVIP